MLAENYKASLEKQGYRIIGDHSAVKTCGWTKKMINGEGGCYKLTFYGIMSHQCMQMSTSLSCANRCTFCWRGYKAPVSKDWKWGVDDPSMILKESKIEHHKLLNGFGGSKKANKNLYEHSKNIKHVALSLTGEPITYPKMNELIDKFNTEGISTFVVTNGQYPEAIKTLKPVTQLYVSVDAPNKSLLKKIDVPLFDDYYERLLLSLDYLKEKKQRTCIRLTLIRDQNMTDLQGYVDLIRRGDPDFIEIKGYVYAGASQLRMKHTDQPFHEEVIAFTDELMKLLPEYEFVVDHVASKVTMSAKKTYKIDDKWFTWIDFVKYQELVLKGDDLVSADFMKKTPKVGHTNPPLNSLQ